MQQKAQNKKKIKIRITSQKIGTSGRIFYRFEVPVFSKHRSVSGLDFFGFRKTELSETEKTVTALLGLHDDTEISTILKTVGLEDCMNKPVKSYSLGMKQRLKLGMALLEKPNLLILDEPINGLDPNGIADLRELLQSHRFLFQK